ISVERSNTINNTGCFTICKITSLLEYILLDSSVDVLSFISLMPNRTIIADKITENDVSWNVAPYPRKSANTPPNIGPIRFPVMLPVCKVPRTFPATSSGVCVAMSAWDIGINPVKIPMTKRKIKSCQTDVEKPIKKLKNQTQWQKKIINFLLRIYRYY